MEKIFNLILGETPKINDVKMKLKHAAVCVPGSTLLSANDQAKPFTKLYKTQTGLRNFLIKDRQRESGYHTFLSINSYCENAKSRNTDNAVAMNSIVIDIDFHDSDDPWFFAEQLRKFMVTDECVKFFVEKKIPLPSVLCHTGRGLQLWYPLYATYIGLSWLRKIIAENLCDRLESLLGEYPISFPDASIDRMSSERQDGLFRAPYSWNPNAKCFVTPYMLQEKKWDINELKDFMGIKIKKSGSRHKTRVNAVSYIPKKRRELIEEKVKNGYMPPSRNELLFAYAVDLFKEYDEETVLSKMRHLNHYFCGEKGPLADAELRATVRSVFRHDYKLSNKMFSLKTGLDVTYKRDSNKARNKRNRAKKSLIINRIRKYHKMGFTIKQISKMVEKCENTVRKYLKPIIKNEQKRKINRDFISAMKKIQSSISSLKFLLNTGSLSEYYAKDQIGRLEYLEELLLENKTRAGTEKALVIFTDWKQRGMVWNAISKIEAHIHIMS